MMPLRFRAFARGSVYSQLQTYFVWRLAMTPQSQVQAYALRHRVYCEELGWELSGAAEEALESDVFDARSEHALLVHRSSSQVVGCIRLVSSGAADAHTTLPCLNVLGTLVGAAAAASPQLAAALTQPSLGCELSRCTIASEFRRRRADGPAPLGLDSGEQLPATGIHDPRDRGPLPAIGLVLAAAAMFVRSPAQYAFALMAPALARLLAGLGFCLRPVSSAIEYHGVRQLYLFDRHEVMRYTEPSMLASIAAVHRQLYGNGPDGWCMPVAPFGPVVPSCYSTRCDPDAVGKLGCTWLTC